MMHNNACKKHSFGLFECGIACGICELMMDLQLLCRDMMRLKARNGNEMINNAENLMQETSVWFVWMWNCMKKMRIDDGFTVALPEYDNVQGRKLQ
jgi:hypothetical protein